MHKTAQLFLLTSAISLCGAGAMAENTNPAPIAPPIPVMSAVILAPTTAPPATQIARPSAVKAGLPALVQSILRDGELAADANLECMAKVIYHEARNQDLKSQLAVAEVIANRTHSGRFPTTLCAVANQPGQFFAVAAYKVPMASAKWHTAMAIARIAQTRAGPLLTAGALFYHSAAVTTSWSHKRTRVAEIGGNIFYR